jgi:flagellar motor switch protein FliM
MSEKILNQDEIDALLKGVDTGAVETAPKAPQTPAAITAFNFSGHDRVVRGRMAALDIVHDRFIKLLTATFTRSLHRAVDIRLQATEIVKFGTLMDRLPLPSSLVIFKMDPLVGNALWAMDASLVYLLTDYYFGGGGQTHVKPEGRDFTPIQLRLIRNIGALALQDLEKAWKGAHPVKAEILRVESNPEFAMVITVRELAVVATLQIEIGDISKEFFLCYPYSMLEPIKEKLCAGFMNNQQDVNQHWAIRLREEIQHCPLEIAVELGQATIHVEDLMGFATGDVVLLDKSFGDSVVASIEGLSKFRGLLGVVKGQQALQVVSVIKSGDPEAKENNYE